ncbi:unnamed protein product [Auanema sp. JU1783]|nr:unnamed protein product [Auanema sp. JU1783]
MIKQEDDIPGVAEAKSEDLSTNTPADGTCSVPEQSSSNENTYERAVKEERYSPFSKSAGGNDDDEKEYCSGNSYSSESSDHYVRLRGLPFNSAEEDIINFLSGVKVLDVIILTGRDGRPSGEAYCQLESQEDIDKALEYDKMRLESRYIEVFTVTEKDKATAKARGAAKDQGNVVRLRGLPYTSNIQDIREFLNGLDCEEVVIGRTGGRPSGEAFVRLASKEQATKALEYNKNRMGTRYIEIFRTTADDLARHRQDQEAGYPKRRDRGPPSLMSIPYSRPPRAFEGNYDPFWEEDRRGPFSRGGGSFRHEPYAVRESYRARDRAFFGPPKVYMRGIPFDADAREIEDFFYPIRCRSVLLGYNPQNRVSGDACIEFYSLDEANDALRRNNKHMGRRYVELFSSVDMPTSMRSATWRCVSDHRIHTNMPPSFSPPPPPPPPPPALPRGRNYDHSPYAPEMFNAFENQYEQYDSYTNFESFNNYGPPRRTFGGNGRQPYY